MATPHVTGVIAQLAEKFPELSNPDLRNLAVATSKRLDGLGVYEQGAGRIDAAAAVAAPVVVTPALQNLGVQRWPHDDDQPVTSQLTYRNLGDKPLTLSLSLPENKWPTFKLSQDRLVVPARGAASVQVVATTNHDGPDGQYHATGTAAMSGRTVQSRLVIDKEPESYHVTIRHLDRAGKPATMYLGLLRRNGTPEVTEVAGDSTITMRLPRGTYSYAAYINDEGDTASYLYRPQFVVNGALGLSFDARTARPIKISGPDPRARIVAVGVFHRFDGDRFASGVLALDDASTTFVAQAGPAGPVEALRSYATATL